MLLFEGCDLHLSDHRRRTIFEDVNNCANMEVSTASEVSKMSQPKPTTAQSAMMPGSSSTPLFIASTSVTVLIAFIAKEASEVNLLPRIVIVTILSTAACFLVARFISIMHPLFARGGLVGKDINKKGTPAGEIPISESQGLVSATIYIVILCILHLFGYHNGDSHLYTAAMACVTFMTLLGFADDVLDLRWRYKLVLPLIASLPLLVNYTGKTTVLIPRFVQPVVATVATFFGGGDVESASGRLVDLGMGYYIYMAMLSIFCTNSINIHAGINGLEAGQVAIIAFFVALYNALNFSSSVPKDNLILLRAHHAFSLDMMLPLLGVTLGLLRHNWYPSKVFVGDTFCYFSGMSFAMASILGHYSSTLLLFFLPQVANFVYSLPQLFGIVHCPRHRLPTFNKATGKLEAIKSHRNLVNLTLWLFGPMTEEQLCTVLLIFQAMCCVLGMGARTLYVQYLS